jgi:RNA polymerase sigma-54 factor
MLSQQLSQRLLQKLSPQQIQLMKLLQIPTVSLEQRIKEELEQNPALEEGDELGDSVSDYEMEGEYDDDFDSDYGAEPEVEKPEDDFGNEFDEVPLANDEIQLDDYIQDYIDDDVASYKLAADYGDEEEKDTPHSVENSFHEHLLEQLGLVMLAPEQHRVAAQIIGSIDDDGYLRREVDAITDDLSFREGISTTDEEVERLLKIVQRFDPPGIAARNLQECLALQLERRALTEPNSSDLESIKIAYKIIDKNFNEFTKKHFDKLQRSLDVNDKQLKDAVAQILRLNPKPASGYATGNRSLQVIIPDFIITNSSGELELALNSRNAPDLHISDQYKDMLRAYSIGAKKDRKEKDAVSFIKQKIDAAKWFIDAIKQRQQTMYKTMLAILQYQEEYFITGDDKKLRPMILKDIAEMTELDISTVSRVANSKYVQTEYGVKSLKAFFSESLQTESGEEVSTLEVKNILQEMISKESKTVPLSDEKLMEILTERGYAIARRTVAKYREQLNIPVARLRKEL